MTAIMEKELNIVIGGADENIGGPKFTEGDHVISKTNPSMGVGVIAAKRYKEGWHYYVKINGGVLYVRESDLTYALQ